MNRKYIITNNRISEFLVILEDYFYKNNEIIAACLFGSFAAGKATPLIDLLSLSSFRLIETDGELPDTKTES